MSAQRIGIMDIRQIIQLKARGLSNRSISKMIGIHRNSINEYVRLIKGVAQPYDALLSLSDPDLLSLFPSLGTIDKSRYETLSNQFEYFRKELKKPGCTRQVLWREYLEKEPLGYGYTQFNEHLNRWLKQKKVSGKLDHKAGEQVYVDYTGKKLHYVDRQTGELIEVEVFVAILPCSGYTFVQGSASQKKEDFIGSMNACLRYYGGVPQAIVPDNLKSAVSKACKYEPIVNKTFKDFALHYGCGINPTRSYSPQDKALVEGAVKLVYQRIFYPLSKMRFFSLIDLNKEIARLLEVYNDYLLSNLGLSRRQQFVNIEQSFLSELPMEDYQIKEYKRATVQKMGYIFLSKDKHYYSVPHRFIGKKVEVSYDQQTVEIYYKQERISSHPRSFQSGTYSTIKNHLSSTHQFYKDWSPAFFEKKAAKYGSQVVAYVQALIQSKPYPEIGYKQCLGIFSLSKEYPIHRLNNACKRALSYHRYGYHIIKNILENNMDLEGEQTHLSFNIEEHQNIRGPQYYQ